MPCTMRPAAVYKPWDVDASTGTWRSPIPRCWPSYLLAAGDIVRFFFALFPASPSLPPVDFALFFDFPVPGRLCCRRGTGHPAHVVGRGADYRDDSGTSGCEAANTPPSARNHEY